MKRLFTLLLLSFAALSCEMVDEKLDELLGKKDIVVFAEGTELTANVPSKQTVLNYKFESTLDWEVKTDAEWLEIDPTSGKAGKDIKIQIKVLHNKDKDGRTGYADLTLSNDESYRITINQAGEDDENEDVVVDIPHNQIWYTSVNGEIVEPYSGEYNEYAEATTTFGVNIVSNTYVDGKGVIEFDGDVTTIGDWAFAYCSSLVSVTIPDSVTTIGKWAFDSCSSLTSITIPDSITTIGERAFVSCSSLQEFKGKFASEDGRCLIIDGMLNSFAIGCGAIEYTIPDSVTTIGEWAFAYCSSLTSVTIPDSVTTIGNCAFYECRSLTSVYISDISAWCNISFDYSFFNPFNLYLNNELVTDLTIPDSVTTIGMCAFSYCSSLTSVTIPDSVTTIGDYAFRDCSSLTSVTIPDSVTAIGDAAFYNCSSLTSVTIPDSVTTIGNFVFAWCDSLTSVTIPDSVTTIGNYAFNSCSSLTSVYCKATTPPVGGIYMFVGNASDRKIYVPMESVEAYKSASYWSDYADRIVAEEGAPEDMLISIIRYTTTDSTIVTPQNMNIKSNTYVDGEGVLEFYGDTIGYNAFSSCSNLTSVTIGDSVSTIEIYAFQGCSSLESITIPDSITTIEHGAFDLCKSLNAVHITNLASWCNIDFINLFTDGSVDLSTNPLYYAHNLYLNGELVTDLVIPDGVNEIKLMAFALCESLTSVTIPNSVTTIGDYAFSSCSGLTSATIPNSVTTIGDYAFSSCSGLTSVTIPDSITTIGKSAFYECVSIKNIVIPNSVTSIGDFAFASCGSLTSVTIPNSVTTLGNAVFRKCSSLTSITIPDSITTIGKSAFYECVSIKNIVIPNSVTSIGDFAFAYCKLLTSVNIPYSVVSIGDAVFKSCNNLRMFSGKFASDGGKSLIIDNTLNAFAIGCGAIEYAIPNGVNMIGNSVLCNCESLTSVTIPNSVTTIGELAFYGCSSLTSVYCKPTTPPAGDSHSLMFSGNASDREIYVPMESVNKYKSAEGWSEYADDIVGYNF